MNPEKKNTILFASDIHLSESESERSLRFINFLKYASRNASRLYILGDLFDYWIGDDYSYAYSEIIEALSKTSKSSTQIYISHGNRDFLLGDDFSKETGCIILNEKEVIDLFDIKTLILHGDQLSPDDESYIQFRAMVDSPDWRDSFLQKPIEERLAFAKMAREKSINNYKKNNAAENHSLDWDISHEKLLSEAKKTESSIVIHGHTHNFGEDTHQSNEKNIKRFVLGDWNPSGMILKCSLINGKKSFLLVDSDSLT